jgi:hypothetical protein
MKEFFALPASLALTGILAAPTGLRSQCQNQANLDSATAASVFVAQLVQRRPFIEVFSFDDTRGSRPLVELRLRLFYGWKERPSPRPGDSATDPLGIVIAPPEDPGFAVGTQVLVLMQRVYGAVIRMGDSTQTGQPTRLEPGWLMLAPCGLRVLDNEERLLHTFGEPQWRVANP